mmetsp:Transcript_100559/g.283616  ORF Transcript_100559/g.283616 Transcript_100559/m.283616 type:complete len:210 (-) Transcript_100559:2402-3031(-)
MVPQKGDEQDDREDAVAFGAQHRNAIHPRQFLAVSALRSRVDSINVVGPRLIPVCVLDIARTEDADRISPATPALQGFLFGFVPMAFRRYVERLFNKLPIQLVRRDRLVDANHVILVLGLFLPIRIVCHVLAFLHRVGLERLEGLKLHPLLQLVRGQLVTGLHGCEDTFVGFIVFHFRLLAAVRRGVLLDLFSRRSLLVLLLNPPPLGL